MKDLMEVMNYTILNTPLYKFALAFLLFILFLFMRKIFTLTIVKTAKVLVGKTKTDIDDKILDSLIKPLDFLFIIFGIHIASMVLKIDDKVIIFTKSMMIVAFFWFLFDLVKAFEENILHLFSKKVSREIGLFLVKATKVFIITLGIVAFLQNLGINVSAFIASLGLGGLAFALAAKDTAANLFGGFAILTDNMFKIGDWIKVGSAEGIVEDIGMRTTKIRAFDKRIIVVPNATIANSAVENFSRRDRRRIVMRIGLVYSTTPAVMNRILQETRKMLQNHPMIHKEPLFVYFDEFDDSSLSLFFYLFTKTSDWEKYLQIREDINLKIIDIVNKNGSNFAFPSQSVYFENELDVKNQNILLDQN
jgi:MscS family membrane protein